MDIVTLLRAAARRQKWGLAGMFALVFILSLSVVTAITVSDHSGRHIADEMERLGYGDITAWTSGAADTEALAEEIGALEDVASVGVQPLIYAGYTANGHHSDNEGQLLPFQTGQYDYRFLNDELIGYQSVEAIDPGEIYVSPALRESFDLSIGDELRFELSRDGGTQIFQVKGYFEDPFMGSSMIDMKSFLISEADFASAAEQISQTSDFNILGRTGAMLHILQETGSSHSVSELNQDMNAHTGLAQYTEFVYSDTSIYGFMMILQNIFTGFLTAFSAVLVLISLVVMGHSISNTIEQEYKDLCILKTLGCTSRRLRLVQLLLYLTVIAMGLLFGLLGAVPAANVAARLTVTSTGMLMPAGVSLGRSLLFCVVILSLFALFIYLKTIKIAAIAPVSGITGNQSVQSRHTTVTSALVPGRLTLSLALRQLFSGKRRYIGICFVAVLLSFFAAAIGRMNTWLGPEGEGLMNAFSVAEHDLGVQPLADADMEEVEQIILAYSPIESTYELAMQSVSVNGVDYTANAIDRPELFHILAGTASTESDQIVITEFVAADLGIGIGDTVTVAGNNGEAVYTVSGIYECANEMGANIGMSRAGYEQISSGDPYIWCRHYILSDSRENEALAAELQDLYQVELSVHTNSWSGLDGIVNTMHLLLIGMYGIMAVFILVVIALTGTKFLNAEQRDMAIYKSIGFTSNRLRLAFALRFGIVVAAGSAVGTGLAGILADPILGTLLTRFGIGTFHTSFGLADSVLPPAVITLLFLLFAYAVAVRVKRVALTTLIRIDG